MQNPKIKDKVEQLINSRGMSLNDDDVPQQEEVPEKDIDEEDDADEESADEDCLI